MSTTITQSDWYPIILSAIRPEWKEFFNNNSEYLRQINQLLLTHNTTPRGLEIFTAYQLIDPNNIKVVIIGQDPYYQELGFLDHTGRYATKAMGAAFSLRPMDPNAQSLTMIYKELERSIPDFRRPSHGYLESWAQQGVFLLNSSLTTNIGEANCHPITWKIFIAKTIEYIESRNPNLCYVRWGRNAQKLPVGNSFMKFDAAHPANRNGGRGEGFIGCNHFNLVNEHLVSRGLTPIDWLSICRIRYNSTQ